MLYFVQGKIYNNIKHAVTYKLKAECIEIKCFKNTIKRY